MKLKAISDFRNTHKFKVPGAANEDHIHKGAEFEVDEKDKSLLPILAQLAAAGRIVDAGNKEAWAAIDAEVKAEKVKAEKEAKK